VPPQSPTRSLLRPIVSARSVERLAVFAAKILSAIDALNTRSGTAVFTVRDVVDELERRGTRYAVSTITTMVSSHMCVEGTSPTQWPDLRRVDRGVYRRLRPDERP
jgi:hypothetical protein